jgi:hypothetical protein
LFVENISLGRAIYPKEREVTGVWRKLHNDSFMSALGLTHSLVQRVLQALFLGVKRPAREADHSAPSSAEVKNGGAIPPLPHMSS